MTEEQSLALIIQGRIIQAEDSLNAAQLILDGGFIRDGVNRLYYGMFYAVLASLALKGLGTSKHQGAIALFDREFIKPGIFPVTHAKNLHKIFSMRLAADYRDSPNITLQEAEGYLVQARDFVESVKRYLIDQLKLTEK